LPAEEAESLRDEISPLISLFSTPLAPIERALRQPSLVQGIVSKSVTSPLINDERRAGWKRYASAVIQAGGEMKGEGASRMNVPERSTKG
jgi:hypothetical protein